MRIRLPILFCAAVLSLGATGWSAAANAPSAARPILAQIEITHPARAVSRYEYGMFIENLGQLVYRSLWAQMLDDRKFFAPIRPAHAGPVQPATGFARVFVLRRWRPIGAPAAVTMDPHRPFVGAHSPRIALAGDAVRGIRQHGLAVLAGKRYTGYIELRELGPEGRAPGTGARSARRVHRTAVAGGRSRRRG